jgi:hypothetical protein
LRLEGLGKLKNPMEQSYYNSLDKFYIRILKNRAQLQTLFLRENQGGEDLHDVWGDVTSTVFSQKP